MVRYNLWFGRVENGNVTVERDENKLVELFLSSYNENPLPFSISELGREVFGDDYYRILRRVAIRVAEEVVERELRREDRYVIALVKALEELDEVINMMKEKRDEIEEVEGIRRGESISEKFDGKIRELRKLRGEVEKEIKSAVRRLAPNLSEVAGEVLAAKLMEKTGGLEKLARLPASKIQVIGAEKSLYKAFARMRRGKKAKVPKHGVIFRHPYIRTLPKSKRGKMARYLASKIAIASRIDFFRGELEDGLAESVRRRYEELARK